MTDENLWEWVDNNIDYEDFGPDPTQTILEVAKAKAEASGHSGNYEGFEAAILGGKPIVQEHRRQLEQAVKSYDDLDDVHEISNVLDKNDKLDDSRFPGLKQGHLDKASEKIRNLVEEGSKKFQDIDDLKDFQNTVTKELDGNLPDVENALDVTVGEMEQKLGEQVLREEAKQKRVEDYSEATRRIRAATTASEVDDIYDEITGRSEFADFQDVVGTKRSQDSLKRFADHRKDLLK